MVHRVCEQALPLLAGDAGEGLGAGELAELAHRLERGTRLRRQVEEADPPVGGVAAPLDEPGRLEPVQDAQQRDRLDLEDLGEADLVDPLVLGEVDQHLPLRAGEPEAAHALLEPLAQQAGDVVQHEAEGRLEWKPSRVSSGYADRKQAYHTLQI